MLMLLYLVPENDFLRNVKSLLQNFFFIAHTIIMLTRIYDRKRSPILRVIIKNLDVWRCH